MFRVRIVPILGLVAAVALSALPADAAQRGGRREGRGAQPQAAPAAGRRTSCGAPPRRGGPLPGGAGRDVVVMAPGVGAQDHRRGPNGYPGPVYGTYRNPVYGSFRGPVYGPYRGPVYASPYRYSHPYYTFRPRTSLGVGFYAGFAVPFPSFAYGGVYPYGAYSYPAPYPVPYPVPYPAPYPSTGYPAISGYPAYGLPGGQGRRRAASPSFPRLRLRGRPPMGASASR